uniref:Uncharacterized protein n=1 Tax=Rhizophora mucronata TaxID=61149 RepID=A0A2P2K840_RHIMU
MRINCDLSIYGLGKLLLSIQSLREGKSIILFLFDHQEDINFPDLLATSLYSVSFSKPSTCAPQETPENSSSGAFKKVSIRDGPFSCF